VQKYPMVYQLQGSQKLQIKTNNSTAEHRVQFVQQLLRLLV
jgi:hypothetical protein